MTLSVPEAAKRLGVAEVTVRRLIKKRRIAFRRIGDRYLFTESDIGDYLESVKVSVVPKAKGAGNA